MLKRITLALFVSAAAGCAAPTATDDATFTFGDQAKVCVPGGAAKVEIDSSGRLRHITLVGPAGVRTTDGAVLLEVPAGETVSGTFDDDGGFHPDPPVDESYGLSFTAEFPF